MGARHLLCALCLCPSLGGTASAQDMSAIAGPAMKGADRWGLPTAAASMAGATGMVPGDARDPHALPVRSLPPVAQRPPRLRLDLVFAGPPLGRRLEASAMSEITSIWTAYGVDVQRSGSDVSPDGAVRLVVILAHGTGRLAANAVLGSTIFHDGMPEPTVVIYPDAIASLVDAVRLNGRTLAASPLAVRDVMRGRALGRALAHEIGHFLLRSRTHSQTGLMRLSQSTADLVGAERRRFGLSPADVAQLMRTTASAQGSAAAAHALVAEAAPVERTLPPGIP